MTAAMLQRELERMASGTRMPERLVELYTALGNDPYLIKECLARATLVDRLARNFYAFDPILHAGAQRRAEELHRQLAEGALDPAIDHPDRSVVDLVEREQEVGESKELEPEDNLLSGDRPARRSLSPDYFRRERAQLPDAPGCIAPVAEERDAFAIRVVLSEGTREVRVASYVVPKTSWDVWWRTAEEELHGERVAVVESDGGSLPIARDGSPCVDDTWDNGILDDVPESRSRHTAVWTGNEMIVWGGYRDLVNGFDTGGRYDPATDTWTATSTVRAPAKRYDHAAVWTGNEMIVWGGVGGVDTGGRYDPATDTWTATSTAGAPSARRSPTAVWTGSEMIVWGGYGNVNTGGKYDPATDTWTAMSTAGAPSGRIATAAIWTGREMVVWGGNDRNDNFLDTGGRYVVDTSVCDDGNICSVDRCDPTAGCLHPPINCDDQNVCTADGCDPASGCVHAPVSCDDGNACTADICYSVAGCAHTSISCDDGLVCTQDHCDPSSGCTHPPVDCSDLDACTTDSCDPASGCAHATINCDDALACTADSCKPPTGCNNQTINMDTATFSANRVDGRDLAILAAAWNSCPGGPMYDAAANLDQLACIDMDDFHLFMNAFGRGCS